MSAASKLVAGDKYPYDAPDDWWRDGDSLPPPPTDWAHRSARGVISDLTDRRDIKRGFENVDEDIRVEIIETIASIIRQAHTERSASDE